MQWLRIFLFVVVVAIILVWFVIALTGRPWLLIVLGALLLLAGAIWLVIRTRKV